jgi:hypothetical protein
MDKRLDMHPKLGDKVPPPTVPTDRELDDRIRAFDARLYRIVDEHDVVSGFVTWSYTDWARTARIRIQVDGVRTYSECKVMDSFSDDLIADRITAATNEVSDEQA